LLSNMPEAQYLGRGGTMMEMDRQIIKKLTDMLVANFLGQQPANSFGRMRILPAQEYKVWKPSDSGSEALKLVHSRQAHAAMEDILTLRMSVKVLVTELRNAKIGPKTMAMRVEEKREQAEEASTQTWKHRLAKKPVFRRLGHTGRRLASVFIDPKKAPRMLEAEFMKECAAISRLPEELLRRIYKLLDFDSEGWVLIDDAFHILTSMAPVEGHELDEAESGWVESGDQAASVSMSRHDDMSNSEYTTDPEDGEEQHNASSTENATSAADYIYSSPTRSTRSR